MNNRIGLCGSHRTGKTTLAQALAQRHHTDFIASSVSAIFKQHTLQADAQMDFKARLWIQQRILETAEKLWQDAPAHFVTDRTPLDFMAYTLCDIQGTTQVDFDELTQYITRCFDVINQIFTRIIVVQPGIPLIYAEGKAALNQAYIEHLNTVILGLCHDERLHCPVTIITRNILDIEQRLEISSPC
ncbi:MAG: AAA family ATPase [Thiotrichaceae bacterium]